MGFQIDLDTITAPVHFTHRAPGSVRRLSAREHLGGDLSLHWQAPARVERIDGYRVERTREGRVYELLGITDELEFTVAQPVPGEPWFYRVSAFNFRGIGRARMVYFHRRAMRLRPRGPILRCMSFPVPVRPGRRMEIMEDPWPSRSSRHFTEEAPGLK